MISSSVGGLLSNCQPFHQLCKIQTTHRFSFAAELLGVIKFHIFMWVMTKLLHLCFLQNVSNNKPNAPTMGTNSHISYNTLAQIVKMLQYKFKRSYGWVWRCLRLSGVNSSSDSVCYCLSFLFLLACLCFELLSLFLSLQSCNWSLNAGWSATFVRISF